MPPEQIPADFEYTLPPGCIAQHPPPERDAARMLVLERESDRLHHAGVRELTDWLAPGDLLVVNVSRVLRARLRGYKETGGRAEVLLLAPHPAGSRCYRALLRCRGRQRPGIKLRLGTAGGELDAEVVSVLSGGQVVLSFSGEAAPLALGEAPLPPYIRREGFDPADLERYQTVYARVPGSVAAPTAGLHLSQPLLAQLAARGIERAEVVLHVGLGTFLEPGEHEISSGRLYPESFCLDARVAEQVERTRARGGRVVAVGTTTCRVLETCACAGGGVRPAEGETDLFIRPGFRFRVVDALLTNFHLPRSSLLMLVAAFAGRERVLSAYAEAVCTGYRFYSYGDAMLVR